MNGTPAHRAGMRFTDAGLAAPAGPSHSGGAVASIDTALGSYLQTRTLLSGAFTRYDDLVASRLPAQRVRSAALDGEDLALASFAWFLPTAPDAAPRTELWRRLADVSAQPAGPPTPDGRLLAKLGLQEAAQLGRRPLRTLGRLGAWSDYAIYLETGDSAMATSEAIVQWLLESLMAPMMVAVTFGASEGGVGARLKAWEEEMLPHLLAGAREVVASLSN